MINSVVQAMSSPKIETVSVGVISSSNPFIECNSQTRLNLKRLKRRKSDTETKAQTTTETKAQTEGETESDIDASVVRNLFPFNSKVKPSRKERIPDQVSERIRERSFQRQRYDQNLTERYREREHIRFELAKELERFKTKQYKKRMPASSLRANFNFAIGVFLGIIIGYYAK